MHVFDSGPHTVCNCNALQKSLRRGNALNGASRVFHGVRFSFYSQMLNDRFESEVEITDFSHSTLSELANLQRNSIIRPFRTDHELFIFSLDNMQILIYGINRNAWLIHLNHQINKKYPFLS